MRSIKRKVAFESRYANTVSLKKEKPEFSNCPKYIFLSLTVMLFDSIQLPWNEFHLQKYPGIL